MLVDFFAVRDLLQPVVAHLKLQLSHVRPYRVLLQLFQQEIIVEFLVEDIGVEKQHFGVFYSFDTKQARDALGLIVMAVVVEEANFDQFF